MEYPKYVFWCKSTNLKAICRILRLTFTTLGKFSKRQIDDVLYFSQKTGVNISCKLSPMKTIYTICLILLSGKSISKCRVNLLPRVLSVDLSYDDTLFEVHC